MLKVYKKDREIGFTSDNWIVIDNCLMAEHYDADEVPEKTRISPHDGKRYSAIIRHSASSKALLQNAAEGVLVKFKKTSKFIEVKNYTYQIKADKARVYRSDCGEVRYISDTYARRIKDKTLWGSKSELKALFNTSCTALVMPLNIKKGN